MPSGGWPYTPGAGASFLSASPSSSESGFSSSAPQMYLTNFRAHYPAHSSPTLGYNNQQYAAYHCDRYCHNQQQGHQHDHQHSHQFQQGHQHQHEQHDQHLQNKEHPEPFGGTRAAPRAYNLPPAMANDGLLPQSPQRYYLPTAGLQSSSAQSLSSPYAAGSQSPGSAKQDGSLHSINAPSQPFHPGRSARTNALNWYRGLNFRNPQRTTEPGLRQRMRGLCLLFFGFVPHTRALLTNQRHRLDNGLELNRLGSLRPGSDFYRYY